MRALPAVRGSGSAACEARRRRQHRPRRTRHATTPNAADAARMGTQSHSRPAKTASHKPPALTPTQPAAKNQSRRLRTAQPRPSGRGRRPAPGRG